MAIYIGYWILYVKILRQKCVPISSSLSTRGKTDVCNICRQLNLARDLTSNICYKKICRAATTSPPITIGVFFPCCSIFDALLVYIEYRVYDEN